MFHLYRRLIEKEQKVEAITASMQGSGADPAQLEEIEKMMTQLEKEQLQKYKGRIAKWVPILAIGL